MATITQPQAQPNDPSRAGQIASAKLTFGQFSRFSVAAVHTRFEAVSWFVWDAEVEDPINGLPDIIRQAESFAEAIEGL